MAFRHFSALKSKNSRSFDLGYYSSRFERDLTLLRVKYQQDVDKFECVWYSENIGHFYRDVGVEFGTIKFGTIAWSDTTRSLDTLRYYQHFGITPKEGGMVNKPEFSGVWQKEILPFLSAFEQKTNIRRATVNPYNVRVSAIKNYSNNTDSLWRKDIGFIAQAFLADLQPIRKESIKKFIEENKGKEKTMANTGNGTKAATVSILAPQETLGVLGEAVKQGAQVAVADEAANAVLAVAEVMVGDAYPELAKTENGKKLVKLIAATLLHHAASAGVPFIPDVDSTKFACNLVMQAAARDLIQPKIAVLTPALAQLAAVGRTALGAG